MKVWIFVCECVCFHISKGTLRLVFDAVVEGLQNILFKTGSARKRPHDRISVGVREVGVIDSKDIHFNTCRYKGNNRIHVLRDTGGSVECNRCPDVADVLFGDIAAAQEVARGICSIDLKTVCVAAVGSYETDVVEHGACVERFGLELEATTLACWRAKVVDAAGVIEQQSRFCVADELRDFIGEFTVWNTDVRDECCLRCLS